MKQIIMYSFLVSTALLIGLLIPNYISSKQNPLELNGEKIYLVHSPKHSTVELIDGELPFRGSKLPMLQEDLAKDKIPLNIEMLVSQTALGSNYSNSIRKHRSMHLRSKRSVAP